MEVKIEKPKVLNKAGKVVCVKEHTNRTNGERVEEATEGYFTGKLYNNYAWGRFYYQLEVIINDNSFYYCVDDLNKLFADEKEIRLQKLKTFEITGSEKTVSDNLIFHA